MLQPLIALCLVIAAWSLVAGGLERRRLTVPILFVVAGVAVGFSTHGALADALNTEVTQRAAELILAVLLFVDATEVRGGLFGHNPRCAFRVLLIAMPLSLGFAVLLGLWLLPDLPWAVLLLIGCIVVPIDFAPASFILRDPRVPQRVRNLLNVEAGYNDGIISPIFLFALVLAGDHTNAATPLQALGHALPDAGIAVLVGAVLGAVLAYLGNLAQRRDLMTAQSNRMLLVAAPVLTYGVSLGLHGNGFVAAFVSGIAFHYLRRTEHPEQQLELIDDLSFLLTLAMWFVFGSAAVLALSGGMPWRVVAYCALALSVVRIVPILIAMTGSELDLRDRLMLGWLGPRGTSSIVFGLLAFNLLSAEAEIPVLLTTVVVVLGSLVLHGIGSPAAIRAHYPQPRTEVHR